MHLSNPPLGRDGALVGFGNIAQAAHLAALAACDLRITAVVETAPERRQEAIARLPGVRLYADVEDLLRAERPAFVDICTPPHLHFEAARLVLGAGIHVLCEKPLVLTAADAQDLATLAEQHRVVLACVHNWTHAPILARVRELLRSNILGPLVSVDLVTLRTQPARGAGAVGDWRVDAAQAGGGILFDHGWHGMAILLRTVGDWPRSVSGSIARRRHVDLAIEDTAISSVVFSHGVTGRVEATWAADERCNRATFRCRDGDLALHNASLTIWRGGVQVGREDFAESLADGGYRPTWTAAVVRDFAAEIANPAARGGMLREALTVLQLLLGTYRSAAAAGASQDLPVGGFRGPGAGATAQP